MNLSTKASHSTTNRRMARPNGTSPHAGRMTRTPAMTHSKRRHIRQMTMIRANGTQVLKIAASPFSNYSARGSTGCGVTLSMSRTILSMTW